MCREPRVPQSVCRPPSFTCPGQALPFAIGYGVLWRKSIGIVVLTTFTQLRAALQTRMAPPKTGIGYNAANLVGPTVMKPTPVSSPPV